MLFSPEPARPKSQSIEKSDFLEKSDFFILIINSSVLSTTNYVDKRIKHQIGEWVMGNGS